MASFLIACPERILRHRSRFLGKFVRYPRQNRVRARLSPSVDREARWLLAKACYETRSSPGTWSFLARFPALKCWAKVGRPCGAGTLIALPIIRRTSGYEAFNVPLPLRSAKESGFRNRL